MSKSLVKKGLSFVRDNQDGVSKARRKLGTVVKSTHGGGRKGPSSKPPVKGGGVSKPAVKRSLREVLTKEEKNSTRAEGQTAMERNMKVYSFKQNRSRKHIKHIADYTAEAKTPVTRPQTQGVPPRPPRGVRRKGPSKGEKRKRKQAQFSIFNIPEMRTARPDCPLTPQM